MLTVCLFCALAMSQSAGVSAEEKGVFDYQKQMEAGKDVKTIVFIADAGTHGGRGNHEFMAGSILLAKQLNAAYPEVHAVVRSSNNWPTDLSHADAIVVALNHGQRAAKDPEIFAAVRRGAGFMAIHFGVEVNQGEEGNNYLQWMGGYFETKWSVNPWWQPDFKQIPDHPTTRGVKPFSVRDEWYYHMRFVGELEGVTPILSDVPPVNTVSEQISDRGGNPEVFKEVSAGKQQHMAWAYERPDQGRGFGFTGMHLHENLGNDSFRQVLINAVAWVTKLEIPEEGVPSEAVDKQGLEAFIDQAQTALKDGK
jgi:hypothetical protein